MNASIERYQSALSHVEARVLECFTGYRDGSKTADEIVAGIRNIGDEIRADGDPHRLAALEEIMYRPFGVWTASLNGRVDTGHLDTATDIGKT